MEEERKRELSELYQHMKTTYEAKFKLLEKDVEYLGEVQKYLSSVATSNAGHRVVKGRQRAGVSEPWEEGDINDDKLASGAAKGAE